MTTKEEKYQKVLDDLREAFEWGPTMDTLVDSNCSNRRNSREAPASVLAQIAAAVKVNARTERLRKPSSSEAVPRREGTPNQARNTTQRSG